MMDPEDMHTELIALRQRVEVLEAAVDASRQAADMRRGAMTLGELEATAERLAEAVATIRDAQALLGGRIVPSPEQQVLEAAMADPVAIHRLKQLQAPEQGNLGGPPRIRLSPAEQADRARALAQFAPDPSLPDEIAEMERT